MLNVLLLLKQMPTHWHNIL